MNNTKLMQSQVNTIQTVLLNEEQFNCLEHFMDVKADVIVIESKRAWEDLLFCFDDTDKRVFLDTMPEYIRFVKNHDN